MTSPSIPQAAAAARRGEGYDERVDALRYALLRKLAPGLRHALMGELQAIQLSAEFAARALQTGTDPADLQASVERLPLGCAEAARTGRSLVEWFRPEDGTLVTVKDGIDLCLKLAGEDWFLRGIQASTDVPQGDVKVPDAALRELVVTALLILTDMHEGAADVHIAARVNGDLVDVALHAHPAQRAASIVPLDSYRKLVWADLRLLAATYGVPCSCENSRATLQLARVAPP